MRLEEQSRALTTAVVDALERESPADRSAPAELALRLAREDQRIEGLPAKPIAVDDLLVPSDFTEPRAASRKRAAERDLARRFASIESDVAKERKLAQRLSEFGQRFEEERNASRWRWSAGISSAVVLCGGFIALAIFCPVALPILGRILGWIAGKLPGLAGALGVVSVKAFDAVVKGIERSRGATAENATFLKNERGGVENESPLAIRLSREMDAVHKSLVRARKGALGL
jgi:hypothetical protein